jgi:uncharacterized protein YjbI with pentapeptide repeats
MNTKQYVKNTSISKLISTKIFKYINNIYQCSNTHFDNIIIDNGYTETIVFIDCILNKCKIISNSQLVFKNCSISKSTLEPNDTVLFESTFINNCKFLYKLDAEFLECVIKDSQFKTRLYNCLFENTHLYDVSFDNSSIYHCNIINTTFNNCTFNNTKIYNNYVDTVQPYLPIEFYTDYENIQRITLNYTERTGFIHIPTSESNIKDYLLNLDNIVVNKIKQPNDNFNVTIMYPVVSTDTDTTYIIDRNNITIKVLNDNTIIIYADLLLINNIPVNAISELLNYDTTFDLFPSKFNHINYKKLLNKYPELNMYQKGDHKLVSKYYKKEPISEQDFLEFKYVKYYIKNSTLDNNKPLDDKLILKYSNESLTKFVINLYNLHFEMIPLNRDILVYTTINHLKSKNNSNVDINNCNLYKNYTKSSNIRDYIYHIDDILVCNSNIVVYYINKISKSVNPKNILALKIPAGYKFIMSEKNDVYILPISTYSLIIYDVKVIDSINIYTGTLCNIKL